MHQPSDGHPHGSKPDVQLSDTHGDESKNKVEEMEEEETKVDDESKPDIPDYVSSRQRLAMQAHERTRWESIQHSVSSFFEQPHAGLYNHIYHLVFIFFILVSVASHVLATTELSEDQRCVHQFVDRLFTYCSPSKY